MTLQPGVTCLIGPGDVGKSTFLSAIEFALWPSYPLVITDNDFHRANVDAELLIKVWVANPPRRLRIDGKFFGHLMGFVDGQLLEDPSENEDDFTALLVELRVNSDLEPTWAVVKSGLDPRPISSTDRASMGITRVGTNPDRHLRWARGSSLHRLSGSTGDARTVVIDAWRTARDIASAPLQVSLRPVTDAIEAAAQRLRGITDGTSLFADTDRDANVRNIGQVALHSSDTVPLSRAGAGSQRVVAIAAQLSSIAQPGVLLLDELEHGLEPHRVQAVVRSLIDEAQRGSVTQVLLTTHSPRAIRELTTSQLRLVQLGANDQGRSVSLKAELQSLVRWSPDALLCPRVIVCEGATEVGIARGVIASLERGAIPEYVVGEAADAGGRSNVVGYANGLAALGYTVAAMYDLDKEPDNLASLGGSILRIEPESGNATEHQLFADLTDKGVRLAVELAQRLGTCSRTTLAEKLISRSCNPEDVAALLDVDRTTPIHSTVRGALATTSDKDGWFKRISYGEELFMAVADEIITNSHLADMVSKLKLWLTNADFQTS